MSQPENDKLALNFSLAIEGKKNLHTEILPLYKSAFASGFAAGLGERGAS